MSTPLTEAARLRYKDGSEVHFNGYTIVREDFARDLERKIMLAREALAQVAQHALSNDFMPDIARAALAATEPTP